MAIYYYKLYYKATKVKNPSNRSGIQYYINNN